MQSRTSYFNKAIFLNTLKRFWPLWLVYFAAWALVLPAVQAVNGTWGRNVFNVVRDVLDISQQGGVIIGMAYSILSAMAVWSFLYNSKTMSGVACLPVKREGVFLSVSLAGILPALVSNVVVFGLTMLVHVGRGFPDAVVYDALGLAIVTMMLIFFYGFAILCAQFTGNIVTLPLVYIVLNFTAAIAESLSLLLMDTISYGVNYGGTFLAPYLSPAIGMFDGGAKYHREWNAAYAENEIVGISYEGLGLVAVCCVAGILFAALALILYRRRRMESAGDVVAVEILKPVFKYCLSFGCALISGCGFWGLLVQQVAGSPMTETLGILFFMLFGAFVGYFAAEMLIRKSFRVFRGRWKGLLCAFAVVILCVLGLEFDLLGIERYTPEAEDVEYVQISSSDSVLLCESENIEAAIAVHRLAVEGKDFHEWGNEFSYGSHFGISYFLKNGKVIDRSYTLRYDTLSSEGLKDVEAMEALQNCAEARAWRTALPFEPKAENVLLGSYKGFATREELIAMNPDMSEEDLIIIEYYGYDKHYVMNDMSQAEKLQLVAELKKYQDMPIFFGQNEWSFTAEEMWELYTQCIVPDVAEGYMGKYWVVEDEDYMNSVCSGRIYMDFWYYPQDVAEPGYTYTEMAAATQERPPIAISDSGKEGFTFSITPTVGSRSYQWLLDHGVSLHTLQEEYELTQGYTQYPRYG